MHAHTGYTTFSMNEATDFFRQVVGFYQARGLSIPVQQAYPGNVLWGGEALLTHREGWTVGLGVQHAQSSAAALYGDYGGTLDLTSQASLLSIETAMAYTFRQDRRIQPFVGVRSGWSIGRYSLSEVVRLTFGGTEDQASSELEARGQGRLLGGFGGVRYALGPAHLRAQTGYRHASLGNDEDDLPFNLGYSGFVATLGVEVNVWRWR